MTVTAPRLIGADLGTRGNEFWSLNQPGGIDYKFSYTGHSSSLKAYEKCPPLTAIINKKAQSFINGKTFILDKKGKRKDKESTNEVARKLRSLLSKPNPIQSQKEFEAQQYIYTMLFGWCLVVPFKPVGFSNIDAERLWNIPPSIINVEETKKNWLLAKSNADIIKSIIISFGDQRTHIPVNDVYIIKDFTPSFKSSVFPESRVCSLEMPINNIIGAYESRNVLINYRGALGIISPDSKDVGGPVPLKDDDKTELQNDFLRYGLSRTQWKFIISSASIKWSQMGVPTRDLMLFEEVEDSIMRICDSYGFPYPLIASNRTNNLGGNNIGEAKKWLYQDATIPEADSFCEQWGNFFELDKHDLVIMKDFSHIAALQDDEQKKAQARKTRNEAYQTEFFMNVSTLNQWRVANGEDPLDGEDGSLFYYELLKKGWVFETNTPKLIMGTENNGQQQPTPEETE
jgi:hypothetical protein